MAAIPMQIEVLEPALGLVIARQLDPLPRFRVGAETRLAGCAIVEVNLPPTQDVDTAMRDDLHAFRFRQREDATKFKVGEVVQLSDYRDAPPPARPPLG